MINSAKPIMTAGEDDGFRQQLNPSYELFAGLLNFCHGKAVIAALGLEPDAVSDLDLLEQRVVPDLIDHGHRFLEAEARGRTMLQRDAPGALIDLTDLT